MEKRFELTFLALLAFFMMSVKTSNLFFAGFAIFVILFKLVIDRWRTYVYKHVHGSIKLHTNRIFPDEQVTGELILENKGFIPAFGVVVSIDYWEQSLIKSEYLTFNDDQKNGMFKTYQGTFNLGRKQKQRIPLTITGTQRGVYPFRGIRLTLTDPLGIKEVEKESIFSEELLVYPQEMDLQGLTKASRMPQGEALVRRWIHEDIFFPVGSRTYQAGDAFNRIDFKSSAKLQRLHTKQFDFTAHNDLCVIANLLTTKFSWSYDSELFEKTLAIVARIARESIHKDLRFSFLTNARLGNGMRIFELPASYGKAHYRKTLEVLARFSFFHTTRFSLVTAKAKQRYPNGAITVVISAYFDNEIIDELNQMLRAGFEIYLIDSSQDFPTVKKWTHTSEGVVNG